MGVCEIANNLDEFYDKTIDGIEMKVAFRFAKEHFGASGIEQDVIFEIGTSNMLRWKEHIGKDTSYNLHNTNPSGYSEGIGAVSGDMVLRVLMEDTLAMIGRKLLDKELNTIKTGKLEKYRQSPFLAIKDLEVIQKAKTVEKSVSEFDLQKLKWNDIPFFDIIISASTSQSDQGLSQMEIRDVKINQFGSSEGIDSTEMNEMVKFVAFGDLIPFRKIK